MVRSIPQTAADPKPFGQSLPLQRPQVLVNGLGWTLQTLAVAFGCNADKGCGKLEQMKDEFVGVLRSDSPLRQGFCWEIGQVVGHDDIGPRPDGRRQNVAAVLAGKRQHGNQILVARDQAIPNVEIHQVAGSLELRAGQIRATFQHAPHPLLMDGVGPFRPKKVRQRQVHQQIAERRGVQDTGIQDRRELTHDS